VRFPPEEDIMNDRPGQQGPDERKISRRTLAAGAAWSVPVIGFATAAPAHASSPVNNPGECSKFMLSGPRYSECAGLNGIDCGGLGAECVQIFGCNANGPAYNNSGCCRTSAGASIQWKDLNDSNCVNYSISPTGCSSSPTTNTTYTFSIKPECPNCYLADGFLLFQSPGQITEGKCAYSSSSFGGSTVYKTFQLIFPTDKIPIYIKMYVTCNPTATGCTPNNGTLSKTF
jgi:hypothetical protein